VICRYGRNLSEVSEGPRWIILFKIYISDFYKKCPYCMQKSIPRS